LARRTVSAQNLLNGAWSRLPAPFYQRAFSDLANSGGPKVLPVGGFRAGVRQFIAGTVDFAATMNRSDFGLIAAKVREALFSLPTVGGTIAIAFNKPGLQPQAHPEASGGCLPWCDHRLKQLNCSAGKDSRLVHRSDARYHLRLHNSLPPFPQPGKKQGG